MNTARPTHGRCSIPIPPDLQMSYQTVDSGSNPHSKLPGAVESSFDKTQHFGSYWGISAKHWQNGQVGSWSRS
ncbi:uncharacterized protein PG986_006313 [Apiospora aurea]|uniref:Uncharacterized protein n=1 Tax=Apiospora aurea TaxID=335848 RepID=A0ABR1QK33_9PEZI